MIPRRCTPLATLLVAVLVAACTPATSDGGEIVVEPDARVAEVIAAREVLAASVPLVTAEAERLVAAVEEVWVSPIPPDRRADVIATLRTDPLDDAVAGLAAVELEGDGPDVRAARAAVASLLDDATELATAAAIEVEGLAELAAYDERLLALSADWDEPGQYSAQLQAFEELAGSARELAAEAGPRTATPACTAGWERREAAAEAVAERTDELRVLIRDRRGEEFDELRDAYRQDPFGLEARLTDLDAEAAASCWEGESRLPDLLAAVLVDRDDVATALDPDDL